MAGEVFIIILVAIFAGTTMVATIVRSIFKYLTARHQPVVQESSGEALTASELERLLHDAVREATAPLEAKIDALEAHMTEREDRLLEAPSARIQLDDDEPASEPVPRSRRSVR